MYERRHADRFKIPGATIRIHQNGSPSDRLYVEDMTKSSIRFKIREYIHQGQEIQIELFVPEMDPFRIKGHLIWTTDEQEGQPLTAVIQFLPFGTDKRYNSIHTYEQLCRITEKYSVITDNSFSTK